MTDKILPEIESLKTDYPRVSNLNDEYLFSLVCYRYFFKNGSFDYSDYSNCFVDGKNDGGIDVLAINERDGQEVLALIQGKMVSSIGSQDIIDIFTKMDQTLTNFAEARTSRYNTRLKRIYKETISRLDDQPNIDMLLFVNCDITDARKQKILDDIDNIDSLSNYDISIHYKKGINEQIKNVQEPKYYVAEGSIKIARDEGIIEYGDNGLLVNVSANSIRDLYDIYKDKGLFEQNFRYFFRTKRIDDNIKSSLRRNRDQFWFLNNGLIIGCKDFRVDGDNIKLYDFSIINGCQTATLISEYHGTNENIDFVLTCKIVKPESESQFGNFIADIAEASNSQKPIQDRDLKSNRPEQRQLQNTLRENDPKVYIEIKRGEKLITAARRRTLEPWQYLKNDFYGQVIQSFHLQQPGSARSAKSKIFSSNIVYSKIFERSIDKNSIIDTLKIFYYYGKYLNKQIENESFIDENHENVGLNGRLHIPSIVGFMIKVKRNLINTSLIRNEVEWANELDKDCMPNKLFVDNLPDNFEIILESLFGNIIREVATAYSDRESEEKTVSNFFKTDPKYRNIILKRIKSVFYDDVIRKKDLTDNYLSIFN